LNIVLTNFADFNNFRNIIGQVAPTMLGAVGITSVISTGGIDLSVGSIIPINSGGGTIFDVEKSFLQNRNQAFCR